MPTFVHLTAASNLARIRRAGIRRVRPAGRGFPGGLFAVPLTTNYYASHQWARELKRRNVGPVAAVYFRVPDDERVWVGRYNEPHRWMTASESVAAFRGAGDALGWEVIIPRRIGAREVTRVGAVSQVVGWRYSPESKGKPPFCACDYCTRGEYGARRLRERFRSPERGA